MGMILVTGVGGGVRVGCGWTHTADVGALAEPGGVGGRVGFVSRALHHRRRVDAGFDA